MASSKLRRPPAPPDDSQLIHFESRKGQPDAEDISSFRPWGNRPILNAEKPNLIRFAIIGDLTGTQEKNSGYVLYRSILDSAVAYINQGFSNPGTPANEDRRPDFVILIGDLIEGEWNKQNDSNPIACFNQDNTCFKVKNPNNYSCGDSRLFRVENTNLMNDPTDFQEVYFCEMVQQLEKASLSKLFMRYFFLPGNHDIWSNRTERFWSRLFGCTYYKFEWKNNLFLILNTEEQTDGEPNNWDSSSDPDEDFRMRSSQCAWVKSILADYFEKQESKLAFIFGHKAIWNYLASNSHRRRQGGVGAIDDTKDEWIALGGPMLTTDYQKRHAIFAGHRHIYEKPNQQLPYYVLGPTGGTRPPQCPWVKHQIIEVVYDLDVPDLLRVISHEMDDPDNPSTSQWITTDISHSF